jgi:hypothetical protein
LLAIPFGVVVIGAEKVPPLLVNSDAAEVISDVTVHEKRRMRLLIIHV